ncbi:hypothetical protein PVAP13_9KG618150 [Panicum virgatum]|uniref:Uncharacterized protein n=1 Tax=Panicum virgatum TaxID=38727 RepID=A0A8T0NW83_PANVG|nr:hypothetical protein PVAP13_9KG618150 [Panicum virgatum]
MDRLFFFEEVAVMGCRWPIQPIIPKKVRCAVWRRRSSRQRETGRDGHCRKYRNRSSGRKRAAMLSLSACNAAGHVHASRFSGAYCPPRHARQRPSHGDFSGLFLPRSRHGQRN